MSGGRIYERAHKFYERAHKNMSSSITLATLRAWRPVCVEPCYAATSYSNRTNLISIETRARVSARFYSITGPCATAELSGYELPFGQIYTLHSQMSGRITE
jgi:hypothetical protein